LSSGTHPLWPPRQVSGGMARRQNTTHAAARIPSRGLRLAKGRPQLYEGSRKTRELISMWRDGGYPAVAHHIRYCKDGNFKVPDPPIS
jgi:hypothetical protein